MKNLNDALFEIKILNEKEDLSQLLTTIDEFLERNCENPVLVNKLVMCMDELLSNVIAYAYTDKLKHEIEISVQVDPIKHEVNITIKDDGVKFDPSDPNAPKLHQASQPVHLRKVGGLGLHIVSSILDKMAYSRKNEMNILTVTKSLI